MDNGGLEARRQQYLQAMGIPVWELRQSVNLTPTPIDEGNGAAVAVPASINSAHPVDVGREEAELIEQISPPIERTENAFIVNWDQLRESVTACTACRLHQTRTQTVFGVGNQQADWMLVGEAPGYDEDKQGEPFVGRAGQLLNEMLLAIGLQRNEVYIANILKCRPPNNRDPLVEEAAQCEAFLEQQIALVKPKILCAIGRIAAMNLLKIPPDQAKVSRLRGKVHQYANTGIPVIVMYHPAYLLRTPQEKRKAWDDLLLAKRVLRGE